MVRQELETNAQWDECAKGTLSDLQHRLRTDHRRESAVRVGTPIVILALLGIGGWMISATIAPTMNPPVPHEFNFGGVTCSEFQASMRQFSMEQLPTAQQQAFAIHLQQCSVCQEKIDAMKNATTPRSAQRTVKKLQNGFRTHRPMFAANVD